MAGILGIYGLIVSVILLQRVNDHKNYSYMKGFSHLASGLCCGISSWAAGIAIGIAGDAGASELGQQDKIFVGMMLILIFAEALGLYGLYCCIDFSSIKNKVYLNIMKIIIKINSIISIIDDFLFNK